MTVKEIIKAIEESGICPDNMGIRTCDDEFSVGEYCPNSYDWDVCNNHDEQLNGTCSTGFGYMWMDGEEEDEETIRECIKLHENIGYPGKHTYLIAGDGYEYGNDEGEKIIHNAKVIALI